MPLTFPPNFFEDGGDLNSDGTLNALDVQLLSSYFNSSESYEGSTMSSFEESAMSQFMDYTSSVSSNNPNLPDYYWINNGSWNSMTTSFNFLQEEVAAEEAAQPDETAITSGVNVGVSQDNQGISTSPTASREGLQRMLQSYTGRTSLIQSAQRQKAIYTIDRFDGGINLNKSPRDLSYWEACQMDCLSPAQIGRLTRLGDFASKIIADGADGLSNLQTDNEPVVENYGLHYFKWSDSLNSNETFDGASPTN